MMLDTRCQKLKALALQVIELSDGVILKRGCTEVKFIGDQVSEGITIILDSTCNGATATREEICDLFSSPSRQSVAQIIDHLISRRLLVPETDINPGQDEATAEETSLDVFYWHFNSSASQTTGRLNQYPLVIVGANFVSKQLAASLTSSGWTNFQIIDDPQLRNQELFNGSDGLQWDIADISLLSLSDWHSSKHGRSVSCMIVTSDFGRQGSMQGWNQFCVDNNFHFMPVILRNLIGYVGPLVIPGETACFQCLQARQNSNLEDLRSSLAIEEAPYRHKHVVGFHPAMASILGNVAAFELTKFYSGVMPTWNIGTLLVIDMMSASMTTHKILKIPRCPSCSTLNTQPSIMAKKAVFGPINQRAR